MHYVIKQLQKRRYYAHNIDGLDQTRKEKKTLYYNTKSFDDYTNSKYTWSKQHCIFETCKIYSRGDNGGNNHSANMVSDQVVAQIVAIEEHNDHLEENQYKMADTL